MNREQPQDTQVPIEYYIPQTQLAASSALPGSPSTLPRQYRVLLHMLPCPSVSHITQHLEIRGYFDLRPGKQQIAPLPAAQLTADCDLCPFRLWFAVMTPHTLLDLADTSAVFCQQNDTWRQQQAGSSRMASDGTPGFPRRATGVWSQSRRLPRCPRLSDRLT